MRMFALMRLHFHENNPTLLSSADRSSARNIFFRFALFDLTKSCSNWWKNRVLAIILICPRLMNFRIVCLALIGAENENFYLESAYNERYVSQPWHNAYENFHPLETPLYRCIQSSLQSLFSSLNACERWEFHVM